MQDEKSKVVETIVEYNKVFAKLKPCILGPFYHYPSIQQYSIQRC